MKVFIINHSVQNCGVYQYGKRVGTILAKSSNINYIYLELNSQIELSEQISMHHPKAIIYNHLTGTMPWVTELTVENIRKLGIKQLLIVHNVGYSTFFDYYLHQDPYYSRTDACNFRLLRPLFDYHPVTTIEPSSVVKIGSFGFGFGVKHFEEICKLVNDQFHVPVQLRLHLTYSFFCQNANRIDTIKNQCYGKITNPNISLIFTHDFITDNEILQFLHGNDLNVFLYTKYPTYNGISSAIDYALSVKKPIAVCKSNMFSHITDVSPSICIEDTSLPQIIENKFCPLQDKYNQWTNEKFISHMDSIIINLF